MSEYTKQAKDFLEKTGTKFSIREAVPQKAPLWEGEHGINYWITLSNERGEYGFDFWGSVGDKRTGKKPTAYDVLACLIPFEGSFEDFCADFGFDEDSRTAEKIYKAELAQTEELGKLFTAEQLEALQAIN